MTNERLEALRDWISAHETADTLTAERYQDIADALQELLNRRRIEAAFLVARQAQFEISCRAASAIREMAAAAAPMTLNRSQSLDAISISCYIEGLEGNRK